MAAAQVTQSGHWLPALRPNDEAEATRHEIATVEDTAESPFRETSDVPIKSVNQAHQHLEQIEEAGSEPMVETRQDPTDHSQGPQRMLQPAPFAAVPMSAPAHQHRFAIHDDDELEDDDDTERLDPAWGIKRMSTTQILGSVKRSTSFPAFGATEPVALHEQQGPPSEQAAEEGHDAIQGTEEYNENTPEEERTILEQPQQLFDWNDEHESQPGYALETEQPISPGVHKHDPEESRFEEGLPLMQNQEEQPEPSPVKYTLRPLPVLVNEDDSDSAAFFKNTTATDEHPPPPELTRKDTSAVIDALHMEPRPAGKGTAEELDLDFFSQTPVEEPFEALVQGGSNNNGADDDPWKAMAEDDEFLVEDPDDLLPDSEPSSPSSFEAALKQTDNLPQAVGSDELSQRPFPPRKSSSMYSPHQPTTSELAEMASFQGMGLSQAGLAQRTSFQSQLQQQRPPAQTASSFSDQAKGGYKSPYDLPMELSKPKRRPAVLQHVSSSTNKAVPPPPRSGSISDKPLQSPFAPSMQSGALPSPAYAPRATPVPKAVSTPKSASFFEELPMTAKVRQGSTGGRYTPQQNPNSIPPPPLATPTMAPPMQYPQANPHPQAQQQIPPQLPPQDSPQAPPSQPSGPYAQFQLRPPERLDPFSSQPLDAQLSGGPGPAAVSTRYSPAPPSNLAAPRTGPSPRYSPAPPSQSSRPPVGNRYASQGSVPTSQAPQQPVRHISQSGQVPSPPVLPFLPRTSSPLVHQKSIDATQPRGHLPTLQEQPAVGPEHGQAPAVPMSSNASTQYPGQQHIYSSPPPVNQNIQPPRRSQTQSPSKQRPQPPPLSAPQRPAVYRPASAHGHVAVPRAVSEYMLPTRATVQPRGLVEKFEFIPPGNELNNDPLERWKGAPVFRFGFGGKVISTFPKHVPRFSAGSVRPHIKPTVGEISIRGVKEAVPFPAQLTSFPGPLRAKSKKKDLLAWLQSYLVHLDSESLQIAPTGVLPDPRKRHDEKILLWKIVKSMVEHDGALDSGEALKAVNAILAPDVYSLDEATATQYREDISPSAYRPSGTTVRPDSVDPMTLDALRKHLLRGNRKEAVWHAVDNRLWSHAFLIASTMPRDTWKQVVQEFVKQEVKVAGDNTESLSTLYEIFGGNVGDCVDQLVPPSARAGLQMVSRIDAAGPTKNALDALDKWQETLTLVINNRSHGDHLALLSLGRLLAEYGRIEAAHICFLFSRSAANPVIVGGLDDPQASIVLLGADHRKQPVDFARNREAILLTEVYEFATLVLTGSATAFMPFLSIFKLHHASVLADEGFKSEAQAYCDSLTSTLRNAKVSAYYAPAFLGELEDFSNRLKQVPVQSSSSWMGKPNLEKVSGSLLNKLSSFVAGDDGDADSRASSREPGESGPFARVAGTPSLSRTGSQSELIGYPTSAPQVHMPMTAAGTRYAPNGLTSARSSSELTRGRASLDVQRSPPSTSYMNGRPSPYEPVNMMQHRVATPPANPYQSLQVASPPTNSYQSTPPQSSYQPNATSAYSPNKAMDVHEPYIPTPPPEQQRRGSYQPSPLAPSPYAPSPPALQPSYEPQQQPYETQQQSYDHVPPQKFDAYAPVQAVGVPVDGQTSTFQPQDEMPAAYQPSFGGYAPPEQTNSFNAAVTDDVAPAEQPQIEPYGYAPPDDGYQPYVPEPDSPEEARPKRRQFGDDDDDGNFFRPSAPTGPTKPAAADDNSARKAANDAAAEAAFRAAAEADAAKGGKTVKPKGSGWFGGWLGGAKKEADGLDPGSGSSKSSSKEPAVYRAKLGESKMKLYYDKNLGKWVNPDNPDAAKSAPTPPPPPRAASGTPSSLGSMPPPPSGPPRSFSAAPPMTTSGMIAQAPPGSGPPSRVGTPTAGGVASTLPPSVTAALAQHGANGPSGPPSRPGTAMSNASSIDDLLGGGPPMGGGRKGAKGAKAKKGRYVDVMAQ